MTINVHVVSNAVLANSGTPVALPVGTISTSGAVFETTSAGRRAVSGVTMEMAIGSDLISTSVTDGEGRYLLCPSIPGHGTDVQVQIHARKEGFVAAVRTITLGWEYTGVDLELVRR